MNRSAGFLFLGLSVLAGWLIQHRYADITHDAIIYTLLALGRRAPDVLGADVFLRFGSQDRFTAFTPIYAFAIKHCELAEGAALLTFLSQLALYSCGWLLARCFMSPAKALLATGLLAVLPGWYGSGHLFSYSEDFLTPRLPAEALVLAGLASAVARRHRTSIACLIVAAALHPIMACAGVAFLCSIHLAAVQRKALLLIPAVLLFMALGVAALTQSGPFARFDATWLGLIKYLTPYLFVSNWHLDDWGRLVVSSSVLAVGGLMGRQPVLRTVCICAIVTTVSGLALSFLWADVLHTILPTQMQMWRWIWVAAVLSILLLPVIAADAWSRSALGRTSIVLLGTAALLRTDSGAPLVALLAVAAGGSALLVPDFTQGRKILMGSCALMLVALSLHIADGSYGPLLLGTLLVIALWLQEALPAGVLLASVAIPALACLWMGPPALRSWTQLHYTPARWATFASWRTQLAPNAQVLWPESPVGVWYLLQRPSYWSLPQMAGPVFSRAATLELDRRTASIRTALLASPEFPKDPDSVTRLRYRIPVTLESLDSAGLSLACSDPNLGYVVSWKRLGPMALPPIRPDASRPARPLYLYDCKDFRG